MKGQSKTATGRAGEEAAARYLLQNGYQILAHNVRFKQGEIDLVATEGGFLVLVEVKTRTSARFGTAAEGVTLRKRRQLIRLAGLYLAAHGGSDLPFRFDVVAVSLSANGEWVCGLIRNAFTA